MIYNGVEREKGMAIAVLKKHGRGVIICTIMACAIIAHPSIPAFGQLSEADIKALQEKGEQEGWTFDVGENPATRRPLDRLCGSILPDGWEPPVLPKPMVPLSVDLPVRFDWRDYDGVTPVKDQDTCGSCWAFATVGVLECAIKLKDNVIEDLSEQWLVTCNVDGWSCAAGGFAAHDYYAGVNSIHATRPGRCWRPIVRIRLLMSCVVVRIRTIILSRAGVTFPMLWN